jgi:hypothetical protein
LSQRTDDVVVMHRPMLDGVEPQVVNQVEVDW